MVENSELERRRLATTSYIKDGMFVSSPLPGRVIPQLNLDEVSDACHSKGYTVEKDKYGLVIHTNSDKTDLIDCYLDNNGRITEASFRVFASGYSVYFDQTCLVEYEYENDRLVEERLTVLNPDDSNYRKKVSQYIYLTDEGDDRNYILMEEDDKAGLDFSRNRI